MSAEFEAVLKKYLVSNTRIKEAGLQNEVALFSTGTLDSFAMTDLVAFIEKSCSFRIKAKEITLQNFDSISKILVFIQKKTAV